MEGLNCKSQKPPIYRVLVSLAKPLPLRGESYGFYRAGAWKREVEGISEGLVDESEEPEGNLVAVACLYVVGNDVTVGKVGNLGEALFLASNLKEVLLVYL